MSSWNNILQQIQNREDNLKKQANNSLDFTLEKHIKTFSDLRNGRNTICYYANTELSFPGTSINSSDIHGFMCCLKGLDKTKGLDLILHTFGGNVASTEKIGNYLREYFSMDIEVFVPQVALSGGTVIACASKLIYMGKHSSLGSTDPQIDGFSAYNVRMSFEKALQDIKQDPNMSLIWTSILKQYSPAFIVECDRAVKWTKQIVKNWITEGNMFADLSDDKRAQKGEQIAQELSEKSHEQYLHGKHLNIQDCIAKQLKIQAIENDQKLQDALLAIHHCFMLIFQRVPVYKIIKNQSKIGIFKFLPASYQTTR